MKLEVETLVELHEVSGGLGMIKGSLVAMDDIGVEVRRRVGGAYESTFIPWVRVRHVSQPS